MSAYCDVKLLNGERYKVLTSDPNWAIKLVNFIFGIRKSEIEYVEVRKDKTYVVRSIETTTSSGHTSSYVPEEYD